MLDSLGHDSDALQSIMAGRRVLHDQYFLKAKAEGYAARSAYKLKEINDRRRIIRSGDRVLDLGCAPGSWLQVAGQLVGPRGEAVGIDLKEVRELLPPNARAFVADAFRSSPEELLRLSSRDEPPTSAQASSGARLRLFDVVLSDMAPSTEGGGGGFADHVRSIELCRRVLTLVPSVLKPKGHLVMKVFEGEEYAALLRETTAMFDECKGFKPDASRDVSREMFIVAKSYKGPRS
jgi:23S rRNA (uridine2552-2'-O)-methyltransferase